MNQHKYGVAISLAGLSIQICDENQLNDAISEHLDSEKSDQLFLAHHNIHSLAISSDHPPMKQYIQEASYHWLDGMPLTFMANLLGYPVDRNWRLTFLDWQHSFFPMCSDRNYRVFLLGSVDANIRSAAAVIKAANPNLTLDTHHGYLSGPKDVNAQAIRRINNFQTDILIVGMGMPLQEQWILQNSSLVCAKVLMPVGGYFDYLSGETITPPRWIGKLGLEWAVRLISSPHRLGYRYLIEPWPVVFRFIKEWLVTSKLRN